MAGRFERRVMLPELMDTEPCDAAEFGACLRDLARVNRLFLAYRPTLWFLRRAARRLPPGRALRVLDVGGGYGDALRVADRWAARRGLSLQMCSVDLSPHARAAGERAPPTRTPIRWVTCDVFAFEPDPAPDVVISSLFAHHLEDEAVAAFLRWMERHARIGWFVNDLHRHRLPWAVFSVLSRLLRWHRFVRHDGPVSIGRGFRRRDWERLIDAAGLDRHGIGLRWWLPFRWGVSRFKSGPPP